MKQLFHLSSAGLLVAGGANGKECLVGSGSPPPSPPPMPPWTGATVANVWRLPIADGGDILGAVMLADATTTSTVMVTFGLLPSGAKEKVNVAVLHPNATKWTAVGPVSVMSGTNKTLPIKVPLHRGCAFIKLSAQTL